MAKVRDKALWLPECCATLLPLSFLATSSFSRMGTGRRRNRLRLVLKQFLLSCSFSSRIRYLHFLPEKQAVRGRKYDSNHPIVRGWVGAKRTQFGPGAEGARSQFIDVVSR